MPIARMTRRRAEGPTGPAGGGGGPRVGAFLALATSGARTAPQVVGRGPNRARQQGAHLVKARVDEVLGGVEPALGGGEPAARSQHGAAHDAEAQMSLKTPRSSRIR